jgi:hypothetical protein
VYLPHMAIVISLGGIFQIVDPLSPPGHVRRAVDVELLVQNGRKTLLLEDKRDFIDIFHVQAGDHRFRVNIAEVRNLCLHFLGQELGAPPDDDVGENASLFQEVHTLLGRLGFLFVDPVRNRHIGEMNIDDVAPARILLHLANGLEKQLIFDISHRSADFHDDQIRRFLPCNLEDVILDDIRHMGDVLHRLAEIVPPPFLLPDHVENLAHGQVPLGLAGHAQKPLIVAEVHVHLSPVVEHKYLSVLIGIHGARIHIEVSVAFDRHDSKARREKMPDGGGGYALA